LRLCTLRQRFITTARTLQIKLDNVYNRHIHVQTVTVRNRLQEYQLTPKMPAKGPLLTRDHRRARREFAEQYVNWGLNEWGKVLFTDESKFCFSIIDSKN
jgi:hypothetical protein